jgi:hypothetical protein
LVVRCRPANQAGLSRRPGRRGLGGRRHDALSRAAMDSAFVLGCLHQFPIKPLLK